MKKRILGKSKIEVSPLGLGCWAIGGPFIFDGKADGWGNVDDNESIRAIQKAVDIGINFLDTSDAYGVGHSEKVIGNAVKSIRDKVVIATKFGYIGNESTKVIHGTNVSSLYIERACEASLKRLKTDYIDVYQLHTWDIGISEANDIFETLQGLVKKGKIRTYGWSTDIVNGAELVGNTTNCTVIQHCLNVFNRADDMIKVCRKYEMASLNRSPLAMGFLTGKFNKNSFLPSDDVRGAGHGWVQCFKDGKPEEEFLEKLDSIKEILRSDNRSLVQGALAWIWGVSDITIPIPGFKSAAQVTENAGAIQKGPLTKEQIREIDDILER